MELDMDVFDAMNKLRKQGISVLNQSVLFKGVNDNVETLKELCEKLGRAWDLALLSAPIGQRVQGAAHFEVDEEKGRALVRNWPPSCRAMPSPNMCAKLPDSPAKLFWHNFQK